MNTICERLKMRIQQKYLNKFYYSLFFINIIFYKKIKINFKNISKKIKIT